MLIVGARGFAKEVLGVLDQLDSLDGLFFFDNVNLSEQLLFNRFEILHNYSDIEKLFLIDNRFTLGVGKPSLRHKLYHEFLNLQGRFTSVLSPLANIAKFDVMIGEGVNIITGATIDCSVKIGKGCLLNTACIIGHDTVLEDFVEICPGATISGNCFIGERSFIGSNATVLPGIRIGANVTIGAGALVTKDIPENSLAYGNPAKPIL